MNIDYVMLCCFQIMTNHTLNSFEIDDSIYTETHERYNLIDERLTSSNGILSISDSLNLLQEVKLSWGSTEKNNGALYSIVYNLDKLEIQFVYICNMDKVFKFSI